MRSLLALPHPGDRAGAPSVPVSSAASGFQPFSVTARRLSSSRKPTRSFRRCAVRVRLRQALLRMSIFGRALEDQGGFKLLLYPVHLLLEPVRALVCHASPLLPRRLHRESSRPRGLELAVSIHPQANTSVCGLKAE